MKGAPRSDQFDDIYFSAHDGLEETAHVFLAGNDLPHAWEGKDHFVIAETGFGTGLNFFSAWKLFEENSESFQTLDFISFEKYPLTPEFIAQALSPWVDFFEGRIDLFLQKYPIRVAGFHRIKINSKITLTLIFDDMNMAIESLDVGVDCWFLDGFTPSKNPDMWSNILFQNMARLSNEGASFATFTAAGFVRRGLKEVGFEVHKIKGFKYKADMSVGVFQGTQKKLERIKNKPQKIAIIGGGLAGTSCAYVLKQYGFTPVIYEGAASLAAGGSGNEIGFYNPRFSKLRDDLSHFFTSAYAQFIGMARIAGEAINYDPCGALHVMNTDEKRERLISVKENWGWHADHVEILESELATHKAGIEIEGQSLFLPDSGSVCPYKLCAYYAQGVEVHLNHEVTNFEDLDADAVIICTAYQVKNFPVLNWLPVERVRGQITNIHTNDILKNLKCNVHYGGYISRYKEGFHATGSTFEKWRDETCVREEDNQKNILSLKQNIKILENNDIQPQSGWVGFRTASNDRFPIIGVVPNYESVYVSTAFGSHGLLGSLMGAHFLADILRGFSCALPRETACALSPQRFIDRAAKKGRVLA